MIEQHRVATPSGQSSMLEPPTWPTGSPGSPSGDAHDWIVGEPEIRDLLRDPVIHAVLRRDGLGLGDRLQAIALGRRRLAPAGEAAAEDAA